MTGSASDAFKVRLGEGLAEAFSGEFVFLQSRLELRRKTEEGHDSIVLAGSSQYSPHISIGFYFGKSYARAAALEKVARLPRAYYHIHQYSFNRKAMKGLIYDGPCSWDIDIHSSPPNLVYEVCNAIKGIAFPFFSRFADIAVAREALAIDDSWCFGGKAFWRNLLIVDAALGDLSHFKRWAEGMDSDALARANTSLAHLELLLC